jgi:hypothetical protein
MNPQDPLASLHPLREPMAISWWPPAPGWWLLAILLLLAIAVGIYLLWRHYKANAYRRLAQQQLTLVVLQYEQHGDSARLAGELNGLLKSTALRCYPRRNIASLSGDAWRDFLNETVSTATTPLFSQNFDQAIYSATPEANEVEQLLGAARTWIAKHRSRA